MAPWYAGANRKQMLAWSRARSDCSGVASTLTPSAFSTSDEPVEDDTARVPCLATFTPPPASTRAAAVEMFSVWRPSPPVPQVSMTSKSCTSFSPAARMARAQATISPTVSPRMRMAVTAAATWAGEGSPLRQAAKKSWAVSSFSVAPSASLASRGLKASDMTSRGR